MDMGFVIGKVKNRTAPEQGVLYVQDNVDHSFRELSPGAVAKPPRRLLFFSDKKRLNLVLVRNASLQLVVDLNETILHRTLITPRYWLDIDVEVSDPASLLRRGERSALKLFVRNIGEVRRCVNIVRVGSDLAGEPLMRYLNGSRFVTAHGLKITGVRVKVTDHSENLRFEALNRDLRSKRQSFQELYKRKLERMVASDVRRMQGLAGAERDSRTFRMNFMVLSMAKMITDDIRNGRLTPSGLSTYLNAVDGLSFETVSYAVEITGENAAYLEAFTKAYNKLLVLNIEKKRSQS